MKKISKDSPKVSVEHSMTETKQEHKIIDQNQSDFEKTNKIDLIGNEYTHQSNADQQKYFRISLFTIPAEKKDEFIEQSDSFKKEVRKRLGGGILSAYMIQTERDKILLVGIYDSIENAVLEYFDKIKNLGGVIPAIEMGFFQKEIAEAAMDYQKKVENKKRIIVGVTDFIKEKEKIDIPILEIDPKTEKRQVDKLKKIKLERDNVHVKECLDKIKIAALNRKNLLPPIIKAAKAYATLGEVVDVLKVEFGEWQETAVI